MKKSTILLISTLAFGTAIAPLAGCSQDKPGQNIDQNKVTIIKKVTGAGANNIQITYDDSHLEAGTLFTFKVVSTDMHVVIKSVKLNGIALNPNDDGTYANALFRGENTIEVDTDYVTNEISIETQIIGQGKDLTHIHYENKTYEAGDEIVFKITVDKPDVKVDGVFFNNRVINPNEKKEYVETLKKGKNIIRIETTYVPPIKPDFQGEVGLLVASGQKNEFFEMSKAGNTYKSEPISIPNKSRVAIYKKNGENFDIYSSISKVNRNTSYGAITQNIGEGSYKGIDLEIAGGSSYVFELDLTNKNTPITAKRTKVETLPSTQDALSSLVNGQAYSGSYNDRLDIKHIDFYTTTYTKDDNVYEETSTFDRYENASLTVGHLKENNVSTKGDTIMYKELKSDKLYEVDTFPNYFGSEPNSSNTSTKYNVVSEYGKSPKYELKADKVQDYISEQVRSISSIGELINDSYQGYTGKEDGVTITSTKTTKGFKTNIDGTKLIEEDTGGFKYALVSTGILNFAEDGALLGVDLLTKKYMPSEFDLNQNKPIQGKTGSIRTKVEATYTYGLSDLQKAPANNYLSKYFISSIDSVLIKDKSLPQEGNNIYPDTAIVFPYKSGDLEMKLTYSPETALDAHQYAVTDSSNRKIIGTDYYDDTLFVSKHITSESKVGTSELTISNLAGGTITAKTTVAVHDIIKINSLFINDPYNNSFNGNYSEPKMAGNANSAFLQLGKKYSIVIGATPAKASVLDLKVKVTGSLQDIYLDKPRTFVARHFDERDQLVLDIDLTQNFDFDALKDIKDPLEFVVEFTSANFSSTSTATRISFRAMPEVKREALFGTWKSTIVESGMTYHSTITIDDEKIVVECPEVFKDLQIPAQAVFTESYIPNQENVKWDFYYGSYALNLRHIDVPAKDAVADLTFTQFYYNPFTKNLEARLEYGVWAGGDASHLNVIGYGDGRPEAFTKIA